MYDTNNALYYNVRLHKINKHFSLNNYLKFKKIYFLCIKALGAN